MSGALRFEILGPQRAWFADREIDLGPGKQRAVLAVLLLSTGRPVATGQIVEAVWPDDPPANGPNVVQKYVAGLRRVLEPDRSPRTPGQVLSLTDAGYLLRVDPEAVDAVRFERGVQAARRRHESGGTEQALAELTAALDLWHGEPFTGFSGAVFEAARHRLVELRAVALETGAELKLDSGRHRELVGELVELVAEFPVRERLRHQYMLALYRSGRQAEALAAYRDIDSLLREEYGIGPGEALRELHGRILRADPTLTAGVPETGWPASASAARQAENRVPAHPSADSHPAAPAAPPSAPPPAQAVPAQASTPPPQAPPPPRASGPSPQATPPPRASGPSPQASGPLPQAAVPPYADLPSPLYPALAGLPAGQPSPFAVDQPRRERHPLPTWVSATATVLGSLLPLLSFGTGTWLVMLVYAVRRRSRWLGLAAVGYLLDATLMVVMMATDDLEQEDSAGEAFLWLGVLCLCWLVGTAHVVLLNRWVWERITGRPRVAQAREEDRRIRREQARNLLHRYPSARLEFAIGRPDLPRAFDDGGLVDINAVPDHVLATLPGLTDAQRRQVAMDRWVRGPYASMEELAARCPLPLAVVDGLRGVLLFLPPPVLPTDTPAAVEAGPTVPR
ncbi:AfsR/SARP family transcriptional regulator [Micromonospora zamorensis]|uniref:AfsR/SARP family transcriptional regulator n=1 Tax=Micromonospora zamorensis TaxID=709883 RepID=UPI00081FCF63|nr:AfsR/SARP family transcriptional regulator [Micromonospora zamorensis]SCG65012.1 DNA-binding transcriptional activator of the SARP family [Micromonospora zamorensis]